MKQKRKKKQERREFSRLYKMLFQLRMKEEALGYNYFN